MHQTSTQCILIRTDDWIDEFQAQLNGIQTQIAGSLRQINKTKYSTESNSEPKSSEIIRIYDGPLNSRIRLTRLFSVTSSLGGLVLFPKLAARFQEFPEKAAYYCTIIGFVSTFTFGTPWLFHMMARKYILHIDYDPAKDNYTLYTYSFFLRLVPLTFTADDVALITKPLATVAIRGQGFLMEPSNFHDLNHYKRMVGYDQEMDFTLKNRGESVSPEPELKRPEIPKLDDTEPISAANFKQPGTSTPLRQIPKVVESEKLSPDDDVSLPINLRKKKKR